LLVNFERTLFTSAEGTGSEINSFPLNFATLYCAVMFIFLSYTQLWLNKESIILLWSKEFVGAK